MTGMALCDADGQILPLHPQAQAEGSPLPPQNTPPPAGMGRAKGMWGQCSPGSSGANHHPWMLRRRSPSRSLCARSLSGL